jgi:arabinofuranosyltransferase
MRREDIRNVAFGVLLFAVLLVPLRSAVVDDTFIHLQYARNLAEAGELSFNRGEPTYGATSPLWVALLALLDRAGADLETACRVLAWLFAAASIVLVYRITAALDGGTAAPLAAVLITASEAWFLRWSAVGMETSFAAFMILLIIDLSHSIVRSARRSAVFGLALFLGALSRPEALLLVPLAVVAFLFARGTRRRFVFLLVFAPLFAAWLYLIHRHTGSYFPLTAGAKQGRPVLSGAILIRALVPARIMGATVALPGLALIAGLLAGLIRFRSIGFYFSERGGIREDPMVLFMLLWVFALPAAYAVLDFQVLSRYLVPVIPAAIILGTIAWRRLAARLWVAASWRRAAIEIFAACVILQSVLVYEMVVVPPTVAFSRSLETLLAGMGRWLDRNAPADALVASPDIGAIGWYSHRRILDLGGLVTPEINRMRREIDVERIIEEGLYLRFNPDYLVDRNEFPARFSYMVIRGVRFEPLMRGEAPNLGIRKPTPVVYVLYRLEKVGEADH